MQSQFQFSRLPAKCIGGDYGRKGGWVADPFSDIRVIGALILCEVQQRFVNARTVFALGHVAAG